MTVFQFPSRMAQCCVCRNDFSDCPYYTKDAVEPCAHHVMPVDNSRFFGHFFSTKGRIGRMEYLVTTLIGLALVLAVSFNIGIFYALVTGDYSGEMSRDTQMLIGCIACLPLAVLMVMAGIKRCHDTRTATWYAYIPAVCLFILNLILVVFCVVAIFYLFFQKGEEGVNEFGTEPLKPYDAQIAEAIEQYAPEQK